MKKTSFLLRIALVAFLTMLVESSNAQMCGILEFRGPRTNCNGYGPYLYQIVFPSVLISSQVTWTVHGDATHTIINPNTISITWQNPITPSTYVIVTVCDVAVTTCCSDTIFINECCTGFPSTQVVDESDRVAPGGVGGAQLNTDLVFGGATGTYNGGTHTINVNDNHAIYIQGQLDIHDNSANFTNCDFFMAPGAVIFTPQNHIVTFENCSFQAASDCGPGKMWAGIRTQVEGQLIMDNCELYDAQFGVSIKEKLTFTCTHNLFQRNFIDIYAPDYIPYNELDPASNFEDNEFDGSVALHDVGFYNGQIPHPEGHRSWASFALWNITSWATEFSSSTTSVNYFHDYIIGILGVNSYLDVYNCVFENIAPDPSIYNDAIVENGSAVYSLVPVSNPTCTTMVGMQNTGTDNYQNTFINCWRGVGINGNDDATISYNSFQHPAWSHNPPLQDISIIKFKGRTESINNNTHQGYYIGVFISYFGNSIVDISNNHFDGSQYYVSDPWPWASNGIQIVDAVPEYFASLDIADNDFTDTRLGIYLANIDGTSHGTPSIRKNHFYFNQPDYFFDPIDPAGSKHYGIWADNVDGAIIDNNDVNRFSGLATVPAGFDEYFRGFNFKYSNLLVTTNTFLHNGTAMRWLSQCYGSEMHCNYMIEDWQGIYLDKAGLNEQGTATESWDNEWQSFALQSRINGLSLSLFKWDHQGPTTPPGITTYTPSPYAPPTITPIPFKPSQIPACQQPIPPPHDEGGERDLMDAIVSNDLNHPYYPDESRYYDKDYVYNKLDDNASLRNSDPDYIDFYNTVALENIGKFKEAKGYYYSDDYSSALTSLSSINDLNTIDHNRKFTMTIALEMRINPSRVLTSSEVSELTSIAFTDAWTGGEGVFYARAILALEVDDQENGLRKAHSNNESFNTILFPNPVHQNSSVNIAGVPNEKLSVRIFDATGRLVQEKSVYGNGFPVSDISEGVYSVSIFNSASLIGKSSLVIIK